MRKAAKEALNKGAIGSFPEAQINAAIIPACGVLADPAQWDKHVQHAAASMALSTVYDLPTIRPQKDEVVETLNGFSQRIATYPGAHLVEFFPWMQYIPSRSVCSSIFGLCVRIDKPNKAREIEAGRNWVA
jgi:hypothetical protein